jgi:hypothetical protein
VSARAVSRRAHLSSLALRECEPLAGADRCIWLVGKQSTISNRNTSGSISIPAELSSCLYFSYRLDSLPRTPQLDIQLDRLLCPQQIGSAALCFREVAARLQRADLPITCLVVMICLHGRRSMSLTGGRSGPKISPRRGRSKRAGLVKSPNGPVAGLSPESVES